MLILYNTLQLIFLFLFSPFLTIYVMLKSKYRHSIPGKLGKDLNKKLGNGFSAKKTIWIHALSVGEVTSALPLVEKIRQKHKDINIIFSATTSSGYKLAEQSLQQYCDQLIFFPLDIIFVVKYFIERINPDLFILVETDFWPNFLHQLTLRKIPALLVNGRISDKSYSSYKRYHFFFSPMFHCFDILCVQTESDKTRLIELGISATKIQKLGNLKYETIENYGASPFTQILANCKAPLIVAGSTHQGEEEILLRSFSELRQSENIRMVIAPRHIERSTEIVNRAKELGLLAVARSWVENFDEDILLLDTIGELRSLYCHATISFIGGSLINFGGHNPLEPAASGTPILFGPHMEDFEEISKDLLQAGAAFCVTDQSSLTEILSRLISDQQLRKSAGAAALNCIIRKRGLLDKHLELIGKIM